MRDSAQPAGETSGVEIEIRTLRPADSPRFAIDDDHVRTLAESEAEFPPILVHRRTLRVVDGMHRLRAAQLRCQRTILGQWFDGDEQEAFLLAVESNVRHGLPLSRPERKQAALRILLAHPDRSDRSIAAITGLSAKSIGALRRGALTESPALQVRIGLDGRLRPSSTSAGRRAAAEMIRQNPSASLREIARQAGISVGTVRDVRRRLASGEEPVPARAHRAVAAARTDSAAAADRLLAAPVPDLAHRITIFDGLRNDPSIRLSESGRLVLHQLRTQLRSTEEWKRLAPCIPSHGRNAVADILSACANDLISMARQLRRVEDSLTG